MCDSASKYLENLNQDQSYRSVKIEKSHRVVESRLVSLGLRGGPLDILGGGGGGGGVVTDQKIFMQGVGLGKNSCKHFVERKEEKNVQLHEKSK
jgi:hypothetical protein